MSAIRTVPVPVRDLAPWRERYRAEMNRQIRCDAWLERGFGDA